MKKLLFMFLLFLGISSYGQTNSFEIFNNNNGIPSLLPSQIVVPQGNGNWNVYNVNNGISNIVPTQIIIKNNENYNIYNTNSGIPNIIPVQTIKIIK